MEIINEKLLEFLKSQPVIAVYLHGSRVKGYFAQDSDLDLAVVVEDKSKISMLQFTADILSILKIGNVDMRIVDKQSSPLFLFSIIKDNKLLYERSRDETTSFEAFAMKNYYYSDRIRNIYSKYLY